MEEKWDVGCCGWKDQLMPGAMVFGGGFGSTEWITAYMHTYILKEIFGSACRSSTFAVMLQAESQPAFN
ncbi:unnamed protein product, partial [Wuchereria bancrofti]